jgi:hypothetical protein
MESYDGFNSKEEMGSREYQKDQQHGRICGVIFETPTQENQDQSVCILLSCKIPYNIEIGTDAFSPGCSYEGAAQFGVMKPTEEFLRFRSVDSGKRRM